MVDVEGLRLALKVTEEAAAEGLHDQGAWLARTECGTAGCFAGNWALYRGCVPVWVADTDWAAEVVTPEGESVSVEDFVCKDLGLTYVQGERLFTAENTLADLRRIVDVICVVAGSAD